MKRYFFDYTDGNRTARDYQGCVFRSLQEAREHALILAIHLQCHPEQDHSGWSVIAYDTRGLQVHIVEIPVVGTSPSVTFRAVNGAELLPLEAA
jgi:hypothetical protein